MRREEGPGISDQLDTQVGHTDSETLGPAGLRQAALAALGQLALAGANREALLERSAAALVRTLDVDVAEVLECLPDASAFYIRAGVGVRPELVGSGTVDTGFASHASHAIEENSPITIEDAPAEQRFRPSRLLAEYGAVSGVVAPIGGRHGPFGVLGAYSREPRRFSADEVGFVREVADLLVMAIERIRVERRLAAQHAAIKALSESESLEDLAPRLLQAIGSSVGWDFGALWLHDEEDGMLRCAETWSVGDATLGGFERASWEIAFRSGEGLPGRVTASGRSAWIEDVLSDPGFPRSPAAKAAGLHAALAFPIVRDGRVTGVIELLSRNVQQPDDTLLADLGAFGAQVGQFLEREATERALRESEERHRQIAATLQLGLLPRLPKIEGLEWAAHFRPAGPGDELGGDFYDLFRVADAKWGAVIADVSGKGAGAAAVTALARYTIRTAAMQDADPAHVLRTLNEGLRRRPGERLCTAAYAVLDLGPGRATMRIGCGGHPPPIVLRASGEVERVGEPGDLLGAHPEVEVHETSLELRIGDALILYTDGVTEAMAVDRTRIEPEDFERLVGTLRGLPAEEIAGRIEDAAFAVGGSDPRDDIAILVLRVPERES